MDGASSEHERQPANAFESSVVCLNVDLSLVDLGLEQSELSHFVRTVVRFLSVVFSFVANTTIAMVVARFSMPSG